MHCAANTCTAAQTPRASGACVCKCTVICLPEPEAKNFRSENTKIQQHYYPKFLLDDTILMGCQFPPNPVNRAVVIL